EGPGGHREDEDAEGDAGDEQELGAVVGWLVAPVGGQGVEDRLVDRHHRGRLRRRRRRGVGRGSGSGGGRGGRGVGGGRIGDGRHRRRGGRVRRGRRGSRPLAVGGDGGRGPVVPAARRRP